MSKDAENIARQAFAAISSRFPQLEMIEDQDAPVEISLTLPVQAGLKHQVWLALQNTDELHLQAGNFWLEWFPCTNPVRADSYVNAVCGFLSGRYRILEHYRGTECFKAQLQQPSNDGWETIGTWSRLRLPSLRKTTFKVIVNA